MVDAHRADDDIAFYAADLGFTHGIALTTSPGQIPDVDGALVPGRWLLHVANVPSKATVWIKMGKFEKGSVLDVVAAVPNFPMSPAGIMALEVNVREGVNDQVVALVAGTGNPTANLYITLISRDV